MEHGEEIQMPEKVGQKIVMDTCRYYTYYEATFTFHSCSN